MATTCEVCGSPIRELPAWIEIDGATLRVCPNCARRGTPVRVRAPVRKPTSFAPSFRSGPSMDVEVDPEYPSIVKTAREKLGLTHQQLGKMINVKPSVISHVETGKMKPDIVLARTLMHHLRVNLLVASRDLDSASQP